MIVMCAHKGGGGLGDRIVGLIACKLISKLLNRPFSISWDDDITTYITYNKYIPEEDIKEYHYIDNQLGLKSYLMNGSEFFKNRVNKMYLNQEISQYLYKNKKYKDRDFKVDILAEYQRLYTDTLIPTPALFAQIQPYLKPNLIGIQIRCGDYYMNVHTQSEGENIRNRNVVENITSIFSKIKANCDKRTDYNIYLTTDNELLYEVARQYWPDVIYNPEKIQHIDRNATNVSKCFIDNYILSQCTELYISERSNFGRIAALICTHNNIYNLDCLPLTKLNLISKHEIL